MIVGLWASWHNIFTCIHLMLKRFKMTNNFQNSDLQAKNTPGEGILGDGAEKYIRDVANIEDLPGDDDDLVIDDDEDDDDDIETIDFDEDVDDVETELANDDAAIDDEKDEDYINKDEADRDLRERGLRP
jgi:hypothetical protein